MNRHILGVCMGKVITAPKPFLTKISPSHPDVALKRRTVTLWDLGFIWQFLLNGSRF